MKNEWMSPTTGVRKVLEWTTLDQVLPATVVRESELVRALKRDHDDLKNLLKVLKSDKPMTTRRTAYKKFSKLLLSHAKAEEAAVYEMSLKYPALRKDAHKGYVEHHVDEEEKEYFPKLDRLASLDAKIQSESRFLDLRLSTQKPGPETGVLTEIHSELRQ